MYGHINFTFLGLFVSIVVVCVFGACVCVCVRECEFVLIHFLLIWSSEKWTLQSVEATELL